ncbi:hypothetical protein V6N12_022662 [Hibiscus sabdariffa]|uniref:Uncharacterized protein n=1 Tax=Hibiscus sabdariffa TaxID=183260 RepID=A0ABR2FVC7_9ROSI
MLIFALALKTFSWRFLACEWIASYEGLVSSFYAIKMDCICLSQRPLNVFCSTSSTSSHPLPGNVGAGTCLQPRKRGSDTEGRFPSSPSDIVHSSDLRRAALMRSVQMKTQPAGTSSLELQFGSGQENSPSIKVEERPCSFVKSLICDREYQIERVFLTGCLGA